MRDGWEIKKLGDIATFQRGLTYAKEDEVEFSNNCVLRSNNIDLETMSILLDELKYIREDFVVGEDKKVKRDSILICMSNGSKQHLGKVAFLDKDYDYAFGGFMGLIKPNSGLSPKFLYYSCISSSYKHFLASVGNGANINNIKFSDLSQFALPVPPLTEQERIVAELDCLSSIIEKKKQQLKEYDTLAQSIFYDMFGDPITNEKGLPIQQLGDFATSVTYGTSSPANEGGKFIYLRMNNLTYDGYLDLNDVKTTDVPDKDLDKYVVRKGDILFNRTNSRDLVGKTALFDLDNEMVIAGYIIRVRVDEEKMLPVYVVRYMNTPFMKSYYYNLCKGAVNQANINSKELKAMPLPVPSLTLQQVFAKKIEAIEKQKELIKQSLVETETLFNSRMDYYFN